MTYTWHLLLAVQSVLSPRVSCVAVLNCQVVDPILNWPPVHQSSIQKEYYSILTCLSMYRRTVFRSKRPYVLRVNQVIYHKQFHVW